MLRIGRHWTNPFGDGKAGERIVRILQRRRIQVDKREVPECIAQNITRALNHPNLDKIVENARKLVEREYTHEAAVERYRGILDSCLYSNG